MGTTVETGRRGEDIALEHLEGMGLLLRDRNWRSGHLELDLVMESEKFIHIVEVRSRSGNRGADLLLVHPKETVQWEKQRRLIKAASSYVYRYNITKEVVFDIVSVVYTNNDYEVEYIQDAFVPIWR